jgi:hypothetical protein
MNEPGKLTAIRKIVGKLKYAGTEMADPDKRKRLVRVTLTCESAPGIRFTYLHRLPKSKEIRCRMVTTTHRETRLVCD